MARCALRRRGPLCCCGGRCDASGEGQRQSADTSAVGSGDDALLQPALTQLLPSPWISTLAPCLRHTPTNSAHRHHANVAHGRRHSSHSSQRSRILRRRCSSRVALTVARTCRILILLAELRADGATGCSCWRACGRWTRVGESGQTVHVRQRRSGSHESRSERRPHAQSAIPFSATTAVGDPLSAPRQVTQVAVANRPMTAISLLLQDSIPLLSLSQQPAVRTVAACSPPCSCCHSFRPCRSVRYSLCSAFWQGKVPENVHSHRWTVYLRALEHEDLSYFIEHVTFHLHPTIPDPVRGQTTQQRRADRDGERRLILAMMLIWRLLCSRSQCCTTLPTK